MTSNTKDEIYEGDFEEINSTISSRKNKIQICNIQSDTNVDCRTTIAQTHRGSSFSRRRSSWSTEKKDFEHEAASQLSLYNSIEQNSIEESHKGMLSFMSLNDNENFTCPRCGRKMEEPRLLPCLHPICSPCVAELMNKAFNSLAVDRLCDSEQEVEVYSNHKEICPLCGYELPQSNSAIPPPHYPLQHRLVMNAIRSRFVNRVLCDICPDEVVAVVQCSTCLHNFCAECGLEHEEQSTLKLIPSQHLMRPLWEATKIRRTILCQHHPTHALRYFCIACQQVICKECMWSIQHRGHANESVSGAGKRVVAYLTTLLHRGRTLLSFLLTQYDKHVFSSEIQSSDHVYNKLGLPELRVEIKPYCHVTRNHSSICLYLLRIYIRSVYIMIRRKHNPVI